MDFLVLRDWDGVIAPGTGVTKIARGAVISDAEYDIDGLTASGLRIVETTQALLILAEATDGDPEDVVAAAVMELFQTGGGGGGPPTGPAGGDLSGTYPNPSVATVGGTAAAVIGAHPARTDNPHSVTVGQTGGDAAGTSRPPSGSAGGQLGGAYPNPDVRGMRETGGPTALTLGDIPDGQFIRRVGATLVGSTVSGGGATTLEWRFMSNTDDTDPGSGNFKGDDINQGSIVRLNFSETTANGKNVTTILDGLQIGDVLDITEEADSGRWFIAEVSGLPSDGGSFWRVPVTVLQTGSPIQNNQTQAIQILGVGASGGLPDKGFIDGLHLSNNGANPDEVVDIDLGSALSDDDSFNIVSGGTLAPDITAGGANGLDTGAVAANTWYAVWLIADSTNAVVPASLLSLSATAPALPSGYDKQRRVGWVRTDGTSDILIFDMPKIEGRSRWVFWKESVVIETTGTATAYTDTTISAATRVPETAVMQQVAQLVTKLGGGSPAAQAEVIPDGWNEAAGNSVWGVGVGFSGAADGTVTGIFDMPVGPNRVIRYLVSPAGDAETSITVKGWKDVS